MADGALRKHICCQFGDGHFSDKNTFSITPSTEQEIHVGDTTVIQVASNSDAIITAESSNTAYASVSVDADEKTVTIRGTGEGTAIITISSKGTAN